MKKQAFFEKSLKTALVNTFIHFHEPEYFLSLFYMTVTKKLSGAQFRIPQTVLARDQDISLKSLPKHHFGGTWEASAISRRNISQLTILSETQIILSLAIALHSD